MSFDPVTAIADVVGIAGKIIDKRVTDVNLQAQLKADLDKQTLEIQDKARADQTAINLQDAKSESFWQNGWRPYVGWICGTGLGYASMGQPFFGFSVQIAAWWASGHDVKAFPAFPTLDTGIIVSLLFGMLGLGAYRTTERLAGALPGSNGATASIVDKVKAAFTGPKPGEGPQS